MSIPKLGNTRNKSLCSVLALWMTQPCYPSVAVITVLSVLHRKQLLFSRQSVRLAFPWVKIPSILTHTNHDSQSLAEIWLFCLKCLKWFFRIVKPGTPSAQSTGVQWHCLPLQRLFEWCVLRHPGTGTIQVSGVVPSFLSPCFLDATWTSIHTQSGWTLGGTKTSL